MATDTVADATRKKLLALAAYLFLSLIDASGRAQAIDLSSVTLETASIRVNDLVYDPKRDLLYGSIPDLPETQYLNSVVAIDPGTLEIKDSFFVGSNPSELAISSDSSRLYVGLDGSFSVVGYDLDNQLLLEPRKLASRFMEGEDAVAEDIIVSPTDPTVFFTANDELRTSGDDGLLEIHDESGSRLMTGSASPNNHFAFADATTLITINDRSTSFELNRLSLVGSELQVEQSRRRGGGRFGDDIEASADRIIYTNGNAVDVDTLTLIGDYRGMGGGIELFPELGITYSYWNGSFAVWDDATFQRLDQVNLNGLGSDELLYAGEGRLAVHSLATVGVISGVVTVPEPCMIALAVIGLLTCLIHVRY